METSSVIRMTSMDGREIRSFLGHTDSLLKLRAASDNIVVSSALDATVKVWDVRTHEAVATLRSPSGFAISMTGTSDDLIFGYTDHKIRIMDIRRNVGVPELGIDTAPWTPINLHLVPQNDQLGMVGIRARLDPLCTEFNTTTSTNFFRVYAPLQLPCLQPH